MQKTRKQSIPKKELDLQVILYWIDLGATAEEIAGAHYMCAQTLKNWLAATTGKSFRELKALCSGASKLKLRRNQMLMSEKSATMAIWLGKQWLGQKEVVEEKKTFDGKLALMLDKLHEIKTDESE